MIRFHRHFLPGALSIGMLALTACSSGDEPQPTQTENDSRPIRFAATTLSTKADITTNSLTSFNVYAYTGKGTSPSVFMNNVKVTKSATNLWTYSPVEYWPVGKKVDFYAFAPAEWMDGYSPLHGVPYSNFYADEDLIYAVSPDLQGNSGVPNAQVVFNFRHALSKLTLKLSSTRDDLRVAVSNVAVAGLNIAGNFHFPSTSTARSSGVDGDGYWTDQNTVAANIFHYSQAASDIIILTPTPNDLSAYEFGGSKYVIPQPLIWEGTGLGNDMYITVMGSVYDKETGAKLWPNANTPPENIVQGSTYGDGLLKFPLKTSAISEFKPGVSYTYNLVVNANSDMGAIEFGAPQVESYVEISSLYD